MPTDYKILLIPAIALFIISIGIISYHYIQYGTPVEMGIDFSGGTYVTIEVPGNISQAAIDKISSEAISQIDKNAVVRTTSGAVKSIIIETKEAATKEDVKKIGEASGIPFTDESISVQFVGSALGASFFRDAIEAIAIAFVLMSLVVFLIFKVPVPSLAIISAAIIDTTFAVAMMDVMKIELTMASFAALLMILGYSVDTDILLTTRVLKRQDEGTVNERIESSMNTGITMTTAAIVAFLVLYVVSPSQVLDEIAIVIIFGLIADYIATWFGNVGILRWYISKNGSGEDSKEKTKDENLRIQKIREKYTKGRKYKYAKFGRR